MAVVPMKKMTLCALKKNRKGILEFLQRQGVVEINSGTEEDDIFHKMDVASRRSVFLRNSSTAGQALAVLDQYAPEKKGMLDSFAGRASLSLQEYETLTTRHREILKTANRLLNLSKGIGESKALLPKLEREMEELVPWQGFDLPLDFKGTKKTRAFIGSLPHPYTSQELSKALSERTDVPMEFSIVSSSKEQTCIFLVCGREDAAEVKSALQSLNFQRSPLSSSIPARRQEELTEELQKVKKQIINLENEIRSLAGAREDLKFLADYYDMRAEKYEVLSGLSQSKSVFLLTGYIPQDKTEVLEEALAGRYDAFVEFSSPESGDEVPVLLHNNAFAEPAEGIVESYSLPAKGELDPTAIMAPFYYLLFGLMLSDAAYGLIMVFGCLYIMKKYKNLEPGMKKNMKLFLYCGISTTFWGFMFGSFFGDAVNIIATTFFNRPDIRLAPLWFEPISYPMRMLVFSFAFGIVHLFTGLGVKLYSSIKSGHLADGIYDAVFWYLLVGGAVVYMLTLSMFTEMLGLGFTLPPAAGAISGAAALIGLVGIIFTSGRESKNWGKRLLKGLYGAYGVTSYLSDILSYSRLLALGLATSVISTVFNQLGSMLGNSIPGIILFILVFLIGHTLNLAINALGAYVHTNRLQFVEFFGKFYEGGGKKFNPFAVHTKYFKVKEDI